MNYDEFAFFNQQLAAMLRDGIPLEGALKQLCAGMKDQALHAELTRLETDLAAGTPLKDALARRALPGLYVRMVEIGARSNDLPGVLTLLADHYQRANTLWTRLKGLMVYPFIVVTVSLALTLVLSVAFRKFLHFTDGSFFRPQESLAASVWAPPIFLTLALVLGVCAVSFPAWRNWLRWRLPAFREANLANLASALALMLKNGTTLPEALALAEAMEGKSPAAMALGEWRRLVEAGAGKPAQWPESLPPFPPMFLWLVRKGGENLADGFLTAAEIYRSRASYKIEMALYGALPVSILLLGQMVLWQVLPLFQTLIAFMNSLGGGFMGD